MYVYVCMCVCVCVCVCVCIAQKLFDISAVNVPKPVALAVGTDGAAVYVSDKVSNLVAKLDGKTGEVLLTLGSNTTTPPKSGTYSLSFERVVLDWPMDS